MNISTPNHLPRYRKVFIGRINEEIINEIMNEIISEFTNEITY